MQWSFHLVLPPCSVPVGNISESSGDLGDATKQLQENFWRDYKVWVNSLGFS